MEVARLKQENELLKEKLALSKAQAKTYEEDFRTERLDRQRAQSRILELEEMYTRMQMVLDIGDPQLSRHLRRQLIESGEHEIPVAGAPMFQGAARHEDVIRQLERKTGTLEEQIRAQDRIINALQHQLKDSEERKLQELGDVNDRMSALLAKNEQLTAENQRFQTQSDQLWNTVSRQEARNIQLRNTIVHHVLPTASQQDQGSPDLQYRLDGSKRQCSCLQSQLQASQKSIDELELCCQSLGQRVDDKEREKRSLERKLSDLEGDKRELQEKLTRLLLEQTKEKADNRKEMEAPMERLRETGRGKVDLESRLKQMSPMANHFTTEITQRMEQLESANKKLSDRLAGLTTENDHLRHRQESVHMRVSSRLQETGESLRHYQRVEDVEKLENDIKSIWEILRELQLTGDRKPRADSSPASSPYSDRRPSDNTSSPDSQEYTGSLSFAHKRLTMEPSGDLSWDNVSSTRPVPKPRRQSSPYYAH